jgi:hypothetical protein
VISRGVCRAIAGLALVAAVTACDDNPVAENREDAAYFRLNPSNAAVNVGGTTRVVANVLNQYGAALVVNVTATECNSNVSVAVDTVRSDYEYPERFVITGVSHGESCIVVSGGGVTDTIHIRVVPASIDLTVADTIVPSGQTVPLTTLYQSVSGGSAAGIAFDTIRTRYVVRTAATGAIDRQGNFSGQAPGQTWVVATFTDLGVTRTDSISLRVVAGPFTGTTALGTTGPATGSIATATFTQGAIAFDPDTRVQIFVNGDSVRTWTVTAPANQRTIVLPYGLPAGPLSYSITNLGPNQVATVGTINLPTGTPAADSQEPDATLPTPKIFTAGEVFYGSVSASDTRDLIAVVVPAAGTYALEIGWNDGSDHDAYVRNTTNTGTLLARETLANPEVGNVTFAAPGTYYLRLDVYEFIGQGGRASTYRARLTPP